MRWAGSCGHHSAVSDTHSIDAIVNALYDTISGPVGAARDWSRFRSPLFPGARLVRTYVADDGTTRALAMDARGYEEDTRDYFRKESSYELEIARRTERFGSITHAFSAYEDAPADTEPFKRGINRIQLFDDGRRWWIVNVLWDNQRAGNPIPAEYLAPQRER